MESFILIPDVSPQVHRLRLHSDTICRPFDDKSVGLPIFTRPPFYQFNNVAPAKKRRSGRNCRLTAEGVRIVVKRRGMGFSIPQDAKEVSLNLFERLNHEQDFDDHNCSTGIGHVWHVPNCQRSKLRLRRRWLWICCPSIFLCASILVRSAVSVCIFPAVIRLRQRNQHRVWTQSLRWQRWVLWRQQRLLRRS